MSFQAAPAAHEHSIYVSEGPRKPIYNICTFVYIAYVLCKSEPTGFFTIQAGWAWLCSNLRSVFLSIFGGAGHGSMAGRIQGYSNACFACVYTVKGRAPFMRSAFSLGLCPDKEFKPSV